MQEVRRKMNVSFKTETFLTVPARASEPRNARPVVRPETAAIKTG